MSLWCWQNMGYVGPNTILHQITLFRSILLHKNISHKIRNKICPTVESFQSHLPVFVSWRNLFCHGELSHHCHRQIIDWQLSLSLVHSSKYMLWSITFSKSLHSLTFSASSRHESDYLKFPMICNFTWNVAF